VVDGLVAGTPRGVRLWPRHRCADHRGLARQRHDKTAGQERVWSGADEWSASL